MTSFLSTDPMFIGSEYNEVTHPADLKCKPAKHILAIDSRQRDFIKFPHPNCYSIDIPNYNNVTGIELKAAMLPRTEYNVNSCNNIPLLRKTLLSSLSLGTLILTSTIFFLYKLGFILLIICSFRAAKYSRVSVYFPNFSLFDFWAKSGLQGLIGSFSPHHLNMSPPSQFWTQIDSNFILFRIWETYVLIF